MQSFKTKASAKWANGEDLGDEALGAAAAEMEGGLIDAQLAGQVVNNRVSFPGRGKRASSRTLVAFKQGENAFFIYGFAKSERANVNEKELRALKLLAKELLGYPAASLTKALKAGELIKIEVNDDG